MPKDYKQSGRAQPSDVADEDALWAEKTNAGIASQISDRTIGSKRTYLRIKIVPEHDDGGALPSDQPEIALGRVRTAQDSPRTNGAVAPVETQTRREPETIKVTNPVLRKQEVVRGSQPSDRYVGHDRNLERFTSKGRGRLEASLETMAPRGRYGGLFGKIKRAFIGSPISSEHSIHDRLTNVRALAALYLRLNMLAAEMPYQLGRSSCPLTTRAQSGRRNIPRGADTGFCCSRIARSDVLFLLHTVLEEKANE